MKSSQAKVDFIRQEFRSSVRKLYGNAFLMLILILAPGAASALGQERSQAEDSAFGPVVRAYLGYLRNEQEVVDDRNSRHEISAAYYRRNSNRIRALRQMALRIARETENDYLPELEAVAADELGNLFERPPRPVSLRVGKVFNNTFRFLGTIRAGETFYVFARLDPYEQADLMRQEKSGPDTTTLPTTTAPAAVDTGVQARTRSRRAINSGAP
jgi:hypothetical protein